ncbi:hypothetical protein C8J37_1125 [Rhizobium sp. PP-WC-1G-195]|nr:hypothetical protein C8J37_1125 [Rhizobium sp. PP-WC-1G-195]
MTDKSEEIAALIRSVEHYERRRKRAAHLMLCEAKAVKNGMFGLDDRTAAFVIARAVIAQNAALAAEAALARSRARLTEAWQA